VTKGSRRDSCVEDGYPMVMVEDGGPMVMVEDGGPTAMVEDGDPMVIKGEPQRNQRNPVKEKGKPPDSQIPILDT
jgi:hypothetical protein